MESPIDRDGGSPRRDAAGDDRGAPNASPQFARLFPDFAIFGDFETGLISLDLDESPRIDDVNRAAAALLGRDVTAIVGRPPAEIFPPAAAALAAEFAAEPTSGERFVEITMPTEAIADRCVEWKFHNVDNGDRHFFIVSMIDVTTRKRNENRLRKLSRAVEQSPSSVMITDSKGIIEYVNPRFTEVSGYTAEEVIGRTPSMLKSGFTSPLQYRELWQTIGEGHEWRGEFLNRKKNGELFWEHLSISPVRNEDGEISHYVSVKEDVSVRKEYEKRLLYQAHYDELTKLPNRILITDRLQQALNRADRNGEYVGVAFIDLDGFKKVNDTLGHTCGDDLLRLAAKRLMTCIRASDTVGRLGGDEFLVILTDLRQPEHAGIVTDKILKAFEEPFAILSHAITTTASIGLTLYPADGKGAEILLRNADAAMYSAKDAGRNCCRTFHADLNTIAMRRLRMESLLRTAIARHELFVVYQPQIDTHSGRLIGAEALVRWDSPEFGLVSPTDFIGLAEDCGLIEQIGRFVLETACRQYAQWKPLLPEGFRIGVNVSTRQVDSPHFAGTVAKALADNGLSASCLDIELTESLFALRSPVIVETLKALRAMGVRLAVDDFGTGYSSLSYLREFPVDTVKIDRAFMIPVGEDPAADALVRAIVAMGHSLSMQVVGEGIETEAQMSLLKDVGCDVAQGYYVDKPLSADAFRRMIGGR